jgi:integrase/recombinase XerD
VKNIDYIESFKDYLEEQEKSAGTINGYTADIKRFFDYIDKPIEKVNSKDLRDYKKHLKEFQYVCKVDKVKKKLEIASINRKLVSVNRFIDFVNEHFKLEIYAKVKQEKKQKQYSLKDGDVLTEEEYHKFISEINKIDDTFMRLRNKAMFETMYYTGMRVSEMLKLRVDHVGMPVIEDIEGKGGQYRDIFIPDELQEILKAYLEVRKQPNRPDLSRNSPDHTKALFVGQRGPITRQTVHNLFKQYAEIAGIPKEKAHAHNIRHLFGVYGSEVYTIDVLAKLMGHRSIETTRIYTEKPQSYYLKQLNNRKRKGH